jgi:uncharacterized protein (DUF1501 family)
MNHNAFTRRIFLQRSLAVVSTTATMPMFLQNSAFAIDNPFEYRNGGSRAGVPDDRILVVVQLGGGNDGLNTVIPYGDHAYYNARPQLGVTDKDVVKFTERDAAGIGLHPNLAPLKELYDEGVLALYQGVGYPNPNRSHFKSMDIWHTANPEGDGQGTGWIGRYFDNTCGGEPEPNACVSIGDTAPLATQGKTIQPIAFENAKLFRWSGEDLHPDVAAAYQQINRRGVIADEAAEGTTAEFLMRTALDAQLSSEKIRDATAKPPEVSYPGSKLANSLKMVAQMIRAGLGTRVYYTDMGGFDTHAGQAGRHANLLGQFAQAVAAFYRDLKSQGNEKRVMIMTFSEFGRRVKQNASAGTDHGTAAPMFMIGDMVEPGVHTPHPSLTKLDKNGDLVFNTDFRQVYTSVINDWMGADAKAVLGKPFKPVKLVQPKMKAKA